MGKGRATKTVREAALVALENGPLPLKEIAASITEQGVKLKGKTPLATIRKTLDRDEAFKRPKPGVYALSAKKAAEPEPAEPKSGDEFAPDLQEAAAAADAGARKRQVTPHPKPQSGRKKRQSGRKKRQAAKV